MLFELPDVLRVLRAAAFWDVYYEHCSYFSLGSLGRLFRLTGFEVLDLSLDHDDQYLLCEARPAAGAPAGGAPFDVEDDLADLEAAVERFTAGYEATIEHWRARIASVEDGGGEVVLWGSGSKAVAFLAGLGGANRVRHVVDINPFKQGKFLGGTGQRIVAPDFLRELQPDLVVAMNPIYREEIQEDLDQLGVSTELVAI